MKKVYSVKKTAKTPAGVIVTEAYVVQEALDCFCVYIEEEFVDRRDTKEAAMGVVIETLLQRLVNKKAAGFL